MAVDERGSVVRAFVDAFGQNDLDGMRALLSDHFVGHLTTADGETRDVTADQYIEGVAAMDVPTAALTLNVPDVTTVGTDQVMIMVEVHAARGGRSLHNFSGQLVTIDSGRITELWMVDALPAESDTFWSH